MKRLVKICGLRDAASVSAAIAAGADALGFVFADSVREIHPQQAARITSNMPPGVLRVAVMRHPDPERWREVEAVFAPDVLQTDAADFDYLPMLDGIVRWPVIRENRYDERQALPETFVYEGAASGAGQRVDWQRAARAATRGRMILAGGLDCDNVGEAIRTVSPYGIDVSSAVESAPGRKDPRLIEAFVAAARAAEQPTAEARP